MSPVIRPASERLLIVFSGPSGSGKETMISFLLQKLEGLSRVVTYTTRSPRPGEADGESYHFVTPETFDELLANGTIYEAEHVYGTHRYGSPRTAVDGDGADDLIMELDPAGFRRMQSSRPGPTVGIFLLVPDYAELRRRIETRHPEGDVEQRIATARNQLAEAERYDYVLLNEDRQRCREQALAVARIERLRRDGLHSLRRLVASG